MSQQQAFVGKGITPGTGAIEFIQGSSGLPVGPNPSTHILGLSSSLTSNDLAINGHPNSYNLDLVDIVKLTSYVVDHISLISIVNFNINFVAGNSIVATVDGVPLAAVPFNTDQATTIQNLATQIATASGVISALVTGTDQITVDFAGGTHTINTVVTTGGSSQPTAIMNESKNAPYFTIQSALNAAALDGGGIILIRPGIYVENITLPVDCELLSLVADAIEPVVIIRGKISATYSGKSSISGIELQTNGDYALAVTGSNPTVVNLISCNLNAADHDCLLNSSSNGNAIINSTNCIGDLSVPNVAWHVNSGNGGINYFDCNFTNFGGSTKNSINSGNSSGAMNAKGTIFYNHGFDNSNGASIIIRQCEVADLNFSNTSSGSIRWSEFNNIVVNDVGTNCQIFDCITGATGPNVISGLGTVFVSGLSFIGLGSSISASTQIPPIFSNDAIKVVTPPLYPYITQAQDGFIKVDTSVARTINLLPNPVVGQRHTIKDTLGSAGSNAVTISGNGKNIDNQPSILINNPFGSYDLVYTDPQWSIR